MSEEQNNNEWLGWSIAAICVAAVIITLLSWGIMTSKWSYENEQQQIHDATAAGLVQKVVIIDTDGRYGPTSTTVWVKPETPVSELASRGSPKK